MIGEPVRRIVLVEDDPIGRAGIAEYLAMDGFTVLQAANAMEAITLLEAYFDVRAVLSDIHLPGHMNGISLAWEVKRRWPTMPVTLISGAVHPTPSALPPDTSFMAKPCLASAIAEQVRRMLSLPSAT